MRKHELSHDNAILLGAQVLVDDRLDLPAEFELVCIDVVEKKVLIGVNKRVCERMEGSATRRLLPAQHRVSRSVRGAPMTQRSRPSAEGLVIRQHRREPRVVLSVRLQEVGREQQPMRRSSACMPSALT